MIDNDEFVFDPDDLVEEVNDFDIEEISTEDVVQDYIDKFTITSKYKEGFTREEVATIVEYFKDSNFSQKYFDNAMNGITGIIIEGELLIYKHDVIKALICALEDRELTIPEWD